MIIACNLKIASYLDVKLSSLNVGSYRPYKKPNGETNYIHFKTTSNANRKTIIIFIVVKRNF